MATPARKRRRSGLPMTIRTGDAGCSSKAAKLQAEIMNMPRHEPSIMYSGQCCVNARFAFFDQCPVLALVAAGSDSSCAANICTAAAGVHWISRPMQGGIQPLLKGYGFRRFFWPQSEQCSGSFLISKDARSTKPRFLYLVRRKSRKGGSCLSTVAARCCGFVPANWSAKVCTGSAR